MSVKFGDSNIGAEIGTPSLNANITKPSINVNFNAPSLGASGGNTILRELVNPQFFIGTVTTLEPDQDVYCYLTGTKDEPVLNFGIPKGYKGDPGADGADGADGQAATIAVGSVSTGLPTDPASVTNSGTSSAAVFDFVIPKGDKGDTGATGATGAGVASGGTTGQVLKKKSSTNYDTEWGAVEAVPQGGTTGQVLAKKTNTDFDIEWIDPPDGTVTDVTVNGTSVVTSGVAQVTVPEPAPTSGATPSTDTQYGSVGTSTQYARKDHRHTSNFPTTGTPADLGTAANGTSASYAHSDHVHNYPTIVHVGASAPSDSNIEVWLDTDEQGVSVVTSVNGQSGALSFGTYSYGTDGIWSYHKFDDHTYHAWYEGTINLLSGTSWIGGYFHQASSALSPPSFSTSVTSLFGTANSTTLAIYCGHASDYSTYWFNGMTGTYNGLPVRLDMYGTW